MVFEHGKRLVLCPMVADTCGWVDTISQVASQIVCIDYYSSKLLHLRETEDLEPQGAGSYIDPRVSSCYKLTFKSRGAKFGL